MTEDREGQVADLRESISGLPGEIVILQRELNRVLQSLRRQFVLCECI